MCKRIPVLFKLTSTGTYIGPLYPLSRYPVPQFKRIRQYRPCTPTPYKAAHYE